MNTEYSDDYLTCASTFATLRVFSDELSPDQISQALGIEPTKSDTKRVLRVKGKAHTANRTNGWFYSTNNIVTSDDTRSHLDYIAEVFIPRASALRALKTHCEKIDVFCPWESASGQGGPCISPHQMKFFAELEIEVWWEVYFVGDEENV